MSALPRIVSVLLVLGCGCTTTLAPQAKKPSYAGDPRGRPVLESLPSLDVPDSALTSQMRIARLLSAESLSLPDPVRPSGDSAEQIQAWSEGPLKEWLEIKSKRVEAAKAELDRAAIESQRQRTMAGALVGLVYEDVARVLVAVPVPSDLKTEPEITVMFNELIASHALPYLTQSKRAYVACAGNAMQTTGLEHWASFCQSRAKGLPQTQADAPANKDVAVVAR